MSPEAIPEDSVLRRHYEQMQQASKAGQKADAPSPAQAPGPAASPQGDTPGDSGGLFGWVKRLFGG